MKFTKFRIKNYKGVNDTTITLHGNKGSIYTLVGLNESGKTTLLEAINRFRHDIDGIHAIAQQSISTEPIEALVPKKKKDNFNDIISIAATVTMERQEILEIADYCKKTHDFQIEIDRFPLEFTVTRRYTFESSEHTAAVTTWNLSPIVKKRRGRKYQKIGSNTEEWRIIVREIGELFPRIVYFPTFLFNFPEKIKISQGDSEIEGNEYFKGMIDDALASLDDPLDLQIHIVDRVLKKDPDNPFSLFFPIWMRSDERERVTSALRKLSQKISQEVFGRWKDVLGSDIGQKELVIEHVVEAGPSDSREVFLTFKVKDGYSEFKVAERSLGFRWFFCFLLFTRFFRGNESGESIFLFDEPASNLHSKAQSKLLDSLTDIAAAKNDIIYSTHSHHLINPLWLETTYIVTNGEPTESLLIDPDFGVEDTDIQAQLYRTFVGNNAEKGHYFQPILDRLQVSPSLLETTREGVFTEGKSDFYILNWYKKHHAGASTLDFVPVGGATNAAALMSLYLGLVVNFILLLDSDAKGNQAKLKYIRDLPITEQKIIQIGDVFEGKKGIESLLSERMKSEIAKKYGVSKASKKHILRAFSEALSGPNDLPDDRETLQNLQILSDALSKRLAETKVVQ